MNTNLVQDLAGLCTQKGRVKLMSLRGLRAGCTDVKSSRKNRATQLTSFCIPIPAPYFGRTGTVTGTPAPVGNRTSIQSSSSRGDGWHAGAPGICYQPHT